MEQPDEWAIRVDRLRPPPVVATNERLARRRARRATPSVPGWRRYLPLAVVAGAVWLAGEALPVSSEPPDPATLLAESARLGWNDPADNVDLARDVFARVNDERRARGLPAVDWHPGLAERATTWSQTMIERGYEHSPDGFLTHPELAGAAENIAMGQRDTAELHVGWMESDGHRANILRPEVTAMGVGIVCRADGRMWATQAFGIAPGVAGAAAIDPPEPEPVARRDRGLRCP